MNQNRLSTYLHDHLSGSTAALNLMDSLAKEYSGQTVGDFLRRLHDEISQERSELETLAHRLPAQTGVPRRIAAWFAEKGLEVKLGLESANKDDWKLFEGLESLSIGIAGKRLLWRALKRASDHDEKLVGPDYTKLINASVRQRREVERFRIATSTEVFS